VAAAPELVKPKLRGVFHELGCYAGILLGVPLVVTAEGSRARLAASVFAGCLVLCFGLSALYHRPTWRPSVRGWLRRADHAGVFLLIAGTFTPFGLLVLSTAWAVPMLSVVWAGALAAIAVKLVWIGSPKWVTAGLGLALGWVGVVAITQLLKLDVGGFGLVLTGGILYSAGAVVYASRRPDPAPAVFGYHELFHVLTLGAAACFYAAIAFYVLPRG
jgi:hemolysin III